MSYRKLFAGAAAVVLAVSVATPAEAKCTRLGFSVNDYGKNGPTEDAKKLLDKYIASWAAEKGIKSYKTGTKSVNCELFLDFIVFDEHTCRAEADVCWSEGSGKTAGTKPAGADITTGSVAKAPAKAIKKLDAAPKQ